MADEPAVIVGEPSILNGMCPFCGGPLALRRTLTSPKPGYFEEYTDRVCANESGHSPGIIAIPLD